MTLIALTLNQGNPVMMADVLISSTYNSPEMETPTFVKGSGDLFDDLQGRKPVGLKQKLYVINDRLCLALGGRGDQMRTFLNRVKSFYGSFDFEYSELEDYIQHYPQEDASDLIAIILASTKDKKGTRFSVLTLGGIEPHNNHMYSEVFAGGTGVEQFLNFIDKPNKFKSNIPDPVFAMNLQLIGYWLAHEVALGETLKNLWGAGYEMILFRDGRFVKLEEYTVVLMAAKIGKGIDFEPAPINTIMVNYQDGVMLFEAHTVDKMDIFAAPRIDEEISGIAVTDFNHKHKTLLVAYIIRNVDEGTIQFRVSGLTQNMNRPGETPVAIEFVDNTLVLTIDPKEHKFIYDTLTS